MTIQMDCSFQPNRRFFVFDSETGKTLVKDLSSKFQALRWMSRELAKRKAEDEARMAQAAAADDVVPLGDGIL